MEEAKAWAGLWSQGKEGRKEGRKKERKKERTIPVRISFTHKHLPILGTFVFEVVFYPKESFVFILWVSETK
jgi:hypothetical protein